MIDVIIVPQGTEYQAVKKGLNKLHNSQTLMISIPIGSNRIEQILNEKKFWQNKPKTVLMMGLCGSLSSQFTVGEAILYRDCYSLKSQKLLSTNIQLNQTIITKLNLQKSHNLVSGITSDRIITKIGEKQQLAREFNANVVDMESFSYLNLLKHKGIAVSILRIVSDDLKYDVPNLEQTIDSQGNIKALAMTRAMLKQPIASLRFIRSSLQGLQKLEQIVTSLIA